MLLHVPGLGQVLILCIDRYLTKKGRDQGNFANIAGDSVVPNQDAN